PLVDLFKKVLPHQSRALEARDRELAASRPKGLRVHSRRPRALATMCGDVRFRRTVLVDGAGLTRYPLDEELDLPAGDRVSPSARSFLATCGADVPFARTAELMAIAGGSPVSATTVMDSVRSAGEAVAGIERARARDLFRDGVAPRADSAAEEVLVEADDTWVRMRDGSMAEVKAVVAYAGKEEGRGVEPVRLGCVGEAPGDFRGRAVAQVGSRFDLARVERVRLGTDGEAQYVNGAASMPFADVAGFIDPFHVFRAVGRCAPSPDGSRLVSVLRSEGADACAGAIEAMVGAGTAASGAEGVAAYLRRHAAEIGGGPSMGAMEAEQQHMCKVRMGSFPCAWSPAGADAMARLRSWLGSGFALPPRTRESEQSPRRRQRRERKLARHLARRAGGRVKSEGKGWE
ncbi:UPF0236 family transposase-like protein, partial [Collinsella sp. AF08-23]|uniref:UPF0236 family transposase-like protein n=1 Tax=Collinsella sp. AF08-23 TaxID=2292211 RepID=UPI000FF7C605